MNENELIALERINLSSRALIAGLDSGGVNTTRLLANLKRDHGLLDEIRTPKPLPTAKDIILRVINDFPLEQTSSDERVAEDIHAALVEAGYL